MPTGSSYGANSVRAATSHTVSSAAPPSAQPASRRLAFTAHQTPHHMGRNKPHKTQQARKADRRACQRRRQRQQQHTRTPRTRRPRLWAVSAAQSQHIHLVGQRQRGRQAQQNHPRRRRDACSMDRLARPPMRKSE